MLPFGAIPCELMMPAEQKLKPILDAAPIRNLDVPLMSNVDASPIGTDHAIRNALIRQVVSPVRWLEGVQKMIEMGVHKFVEVGPGSVLSGLIRRINPEVETISINDRKSLETALGSAS